MRHLPFLLLPLAAGCATARPAAPAATPKVLAIRDVGAGSLSRDVPAAVTRARQNGDSRYLALAPSASKVECVSIAEVSRVVVCVFNTPRFMNYALNRASEWIEVSRARVLTDEEHVRNGNNGVVQGHDLRGEDLRAFDTAWTAARPAFAQPEHEDERATLEIERDFWNAFLRPRLVAQPDLILLAVAAGTDVEGTLSHEILHAQYFRDPRMREAVHAYWGAMPAPDRDAIRAILAAQYAVDGDPVLLENEAQAYLLMHRAEDFELAKFVASHAGPLRARLAAAGVEPIAFRLE